MNQSSHPIPVSTGLELHLFGQQNKYMTTFIKVFKTYSKLNNAWHIHIWAISKSSHFFSIPFLEPAITLHIDVIKLVHTIAVYGAYTYMYMYTVKNKVNQKPVKLGWNKHAVSDINFFFL